MEKSKEKMVVFDWGGVIESQVKGHYDHFRWQIEVVRALSKENFDDEFILKEWLKNKSDENGISKNETDDQRDVYNWFLRIKKAFKCDCTYEDFLRTYDELGMKIEYFQDVLDYIYSLKDRCKIAILSNTGLLDYPRLEHQVDLSKFDYVWLSYKMHCRKPDRIIYEIVENESGIKGKDILFVDDKKRNLDAAEKLGWQTCLATGPELDKMKASIEGFLNNSKTKNDECVKE